MIFFRNLWKSVSKNHNSSWKSTDKKCLHSSFLNTWITFLPLNKYFGAFNKHIDLCKSFSKNPLQIFTVWYNRHVLSYFFDFTTHLRHKMIFHIFFLVLHGKGIILKGIRSRCTIVVDVKSLPFVKYLFIEKAKHVFHIRYS